MYGRGTRSGNVRLFVRIGKAVELMNCDDECMRNTRPVSK